MTGRSVPLNDTPSFMNTLVVHPYDETTLELERVYAGKQADVLHSETLARSDVETALLTGRYDRIILLGHGTEYGLCNMKSDSYVFDLGLLRKIVIPRKIEVVAIWCHASLFFIDNADPSSVFSTGMFISEVREARDYFLFEADEDTVRRQFELFSEVLSTAAFLPISQIREYVDRHYVGDDEVTRFNRGEMLL